jgi:hypothetical protein
VDSVGEILSDEVATWQRNNKRRKMCVLMFFVVDFEASFGTESHEFPKNLFQGLGLISGNESDLDSAKDIVEIYSDAKVAFHKGSKRKNMRM